MRLDTDGPVNQGVLEYLCGAGGTERARSIEPAAVLVGSRAQFGSHPDIIEHLWEWVAPRLPVECRALVCGGPVLVAPARGVVFAAALGTEYALRLAPSEFALARAAGAEIVHYYRTAGVTLDLGSRFGPHWVFGTFDGREPEWCAAALKFAEAAA